MRLTASRTNRRREPFFSGSFLGGISFLTSHALEHFRIFLTLRFRIGIVRFQKWKGDGALSRTELLLK